MLFDTMYYFIQRNTENKLLKKSVIFFLFQFKCIEMRALRSVTVFDN